MQDLLAGASEDLAKGAFGDAAAKCREVLRGAPNHLEALFLLGNALAHSGRPAESAQALEQANLIAPENVLILNSLGGVYGALGAHAKAVAVLERAVRVNPSYPWALENLGLAHKALGDFAAAKLHLDKALSIKADLLSARAARADIAEQEQDWAGLKASTGAWLRYDSNNASAWRLRAKALQELGQLREAVASFHSALRLTPPDAATLATFARLCFSALDYETAAKALDEAQSLDPAHPHVRSTRALFAMFAGKLEEAERLCWESLAANAADVSAYRILVSVKGGRLDESTVSALRDISEQAALSDADRISATFALADCLHARNETELAFSAYDRANRLAGEFASRQGIIYEPVERVAEIDRLCALFTAAGAKFAEGVHPTPVFVVGMPRSGTTLIENIIAAHPRVLACGERAAMRLIMQELATLGTLPDEPLRRRWREEYLSDATLPEGVDTITDKNPWNFDSIGLIVTLFPNARIIHVARDPMETGFSVFRNQFSKFQPFTCKLEHIGHYYAQYVQLMSHWASVLGGDFVTINYEEFVSNFDSAAPALLGAAGLDWHEACATHWQNSRVINTMSSVQARTATAKPYRHARRYSHHLAPLANALRANGVEITGL